MIRRFIQDDGFGRIAAKWAYAVDPDDLPEPLAGFSWREDEEFDEVTAIGSDRRLRRVLVAAQKTGCVTVVKVLAQE